MSLYLQQKFASIVTARLRNHKKIRDKYIFSCPLCGDSTKDRRKARGAILPRNNGLMFHCKNCNESMSFANFLRKVDSSLYDEFISEKLADRLSESAALQSRQDQVYHDPVDIPKREPVPAAYEGLVRVGSLPADHIAQRFVAKRHIPAFQASRLWFAPKFYEWAARVNPDRHKARRTNSNDVPRLVIPFIDRDGSTIGFTARSLITDDKAPKYLPVIVDDSKKMIWGLDMLAKGEASHPELWNKIYGVEGPIDGMLLGCAIGAAGSGIANAFESAGIGKDRGVIVYDFEPRNKQIVAAMLRAVNDGWSVCVWPDNTRAKDINDMVIERVSKITDASADTVDDVIADIVSVIDANTKRGMSAKIAINDWKKC